MAETGKRYRQENLTVDQMRAVADALFNGAAPKTVFFINERIESRPVLDYWDNFASNLDCKGKFWTCGRIFGEPGELRWERQEDLFLIYFLTESISPPPDFELLESDWETEETKLILWGEHDIKNNTWWETRIPGEFRYPVTPVSRDKHVQIIAKFFKKEEMIQVTRFVSVASFK